MRHLQHLSGLLMRRSRVSTQRAASSSGCLGNHMLLLKHVVEVATCLLLSLGEVPNIFVIALVTKRLAQSLEVCQLVSNHSQTGESAVVKL